MTAEGILTEKELPFDSPQGKRIVRALRSYDTYQMYRARERQLRRRQLAKERRMFGDGARVTMSIDPVLAARIAQDPRFGPEAFGEPEFERDMRRWHPEFMVKTRHRRKTHAVGAVPAPAPEPGPGGIVAASKYGKARP